MRVRIQKWGNSLVLELPKALAREAGFEEDGEVELSVEEGRLVIASLVARSYILDDLLSDVRSSNLHAETDWGPPVGKETW
jgi:antitoxin MazE